MQGMANEGYFLNKLAKIRQYLRFTNNGHQFSLRTIFSLISVIQTPEFRLTNRENVDSPLNEDLKPDI